MIRGLWLLFFQWLLCAFQSSISPTRSEYETHARPRPRPPARPAKGIWHVNRCYRSTMLRWSSKDPYVVRHVKRAANLSARAPSNENTITAVSILAVERRENLLSPLLSQLLPALVNLFYPTAPRIRR